MKFILPLVKRHWSVSNQHGKDNFQPNVITAWQNELKSAGYEPPAMSLTLILKFIFLSRSWRRILKNTGLKLADMNSVLEFGCGGGAQLVPLFANGLSCVGIDCSKEVLFRAQQYSDLLIKRRFFRNRKGCIKFICEDFLNYNPNKLFDMTFQFGVLEHYLDDQERITYLQKMFNLTKPDGFVVSYVPNGEHPFRSKQKTLGLGGYKIPEIDYSVELAVEEMLKCGAKSVQVLTHDLMGYLKVKSGTNIEKIINWMIYLFWQLPIFQALPLSIRQRHAFWLIVIGKKTGSM